MWYHLNSLAVGNNNLSDVRAMVISVRQWETFGKTFGYLEKQKITVMINFMCQLDWVVMSPDI